jgi:hypothetical protein
LGEVCLDVFDRDANPYDFALERLNSLNFKTDTASSALYKELVYFLDSLVSEMAAVSAEELWMLRQSCATWPAALDIPAAFQTRLFRGFSAAYVTEKVAWLEAAIKTLLKEQKQNFRSWLESEIEFDEEQAEFGEKFVTETIAVLKTEMPPNLRLSLDTAHEYQSMMNQVRSSFDELHALHEKLFNSIKTVEGRNSHASQRRVLREAAEVRDSLVSANLSFPVIIDRLQEYQSLYPDSFRARISDLSTQIQTNSRQLQVKFDEFYDTRELDAARQATIMQIFSKRFPTVIDIELSEQLFEEISDVDMSHHTKPYVTGVRVRKVAETFLAAASAVIGNDAEADFRFRVFAHQIFELSQRDDIPESLKQEIDAIYNSLDAKLF